MKKSLLFSLLTVCTINSALAENIQNLDTPVNWSAVAVFNTITSLHQNDPKGVDIAYDVAYDINRYDKTLQSAKWLCDIYIDATRSAGSKAYNCFDVITKVITAHNNIVLSQKNFRIIDRMQPDTKVYWNPHQVFRACYETNDKAQSNGLTDVRSKNSEYCDYTVIETLDMYNKPYSINELLDVCRKSLFTSSNSSSLNKVCSMFVDAAVTEHNMKVKNEEQIKYDDNFQFKYATDEEKRAAQRNKFLSYKNKIIDRSSTSFNYPSEAVYWAKSDIRKRIIKDINDHDLDVECSGDCNTVGDDTVECKVRYKTDTITVKYIFDDICDA